MSDQGHNSPNQPSSPPRSSLPPQPNQVLDRGKFTPYYLAEEEANRLGGHASTPYLSNNLKHPAEEFPEPRNPFPGSDPIMDARGEGTGKPGELSYEQVLAMKDIKDMSEAERHTRDAKEFSGPPPDNLDKGQKSRWHALVTELLNGTKDEEDPFKQRPRAALWKLKKLAELAGRMGESSG